MIRKRICKTGSEMDVHSRWRKVCFRSGDRHIAYTKRSSNRRERREAQGEITEFLNEDTH